VSAAAVPGVPRPAPAPGARARGGAGEFVFSPALARGMAFVALASWGALHWMSMLQPAEPNRGWEVVGVGVLAMLAMLVAGRLKGRKRTLFAVAAIVPLAALALLAGDVADELLRPGNWGALSAGISRGIADLPGVRVPYRGLDQWVRADIALGGSALVLIAALLAFWPRRSGRGHPFAALLALIALYVVPVVAMTFASEFLRGAVFTLLMVAFLLLEKLRIPDAGAAAALALGATLLALALAPALNRPQPWWDYEAWALETSVAKSTTFTWDHSYGPLTWPRDGRELLRVKAQRAAYWKAENLDVFDGSRWLHSGSVFRSADLPPHQPARVKAWTQKITVSIRNLRSDQFIGAGETLKVNLRNVPGVSTLDGSWDATRTLRRGDTYTAQVYTPIPTDAERAKAGTRYPPDLHDYLQISLPAPDFSNATKISFPTFGDKDGKLVANPPIGARQRIGAQASRAIAESALARIWNLSQTLKQGARTPDAYVQRVLTYLRDPSFSYNEAPPRTADTLDGFLFDAKQGYCQQFSGAMALLLRMGGIPARVSTGFSSGAQDSRTGEDVVRDFDAHSWVEAYYPGWGWLPFDPTPGASPARSQTDDVGGLEGSGAGSKGPSIGDQPGLRKGAAAVATDSAPWWRIPLLGLAALALAGLALKLVRRWRRGAPPALSELERALRRTRRAPAPGTTLHALELRFAATPAAVGYVRALREARYGPPPTRADTPTRAQRRGLRSELARGGGLLGRLRAWWALPPR
jgi:transglutaminase-like putative cysteine protease